MRLVVTLPLRQVNCRLTEGILADRHTLITRSSRNSSYNMSVSLTYAYPHSPRQSGYSIASLKFLHPGWKAATYSIKRICTKTTNQLFWFQLRKFVQSKRAGKFVFQNICHFVYDVRLFAKDENQNDRSKTQFCRVWLIQQKLERLIWAVKNEQVCSFFVLLNALWAFPPPHSVCDPFCARAFVFWRTMLSVNESPRGLPRVPMEQNQWGWVWKLSWSDTAVTCCINDITLDAETVDVPKCWYPLQLRYFSVRPAGVF